MDAIEQTIRNALEGGDARNEAFRKRIYLKAFSVFDRVLGERTSLDEQEREQRREMLRTAILAIESEYQPAAETDWRVNASSSEEGPGARPPEEVVKFREFAGNGDYGTEDRSQWSTKRRRPLVAGSVLLLLAVITGGATWWSVQNGSMAPPAGLKDTVNGLIAAVRQFDFRDDRLSGDRGSEMTSGEKAASENTGDITSTGSLPLARTGSAGSSEFVTAAVLVDASLTELEVGVPEGTELSGPNTTGANTIHSSVPAAPSSQTTGGAFIKLGSEIEKAVGGHRLRATVWVRQAAENPSSEFAVAYSTNSVGNSGWRMFTPKPGFDAYSFEYDVPEPAGGPAEDYLGIWADTSGSGGGIDLLRVRIEVLKAKETETPRAELLVREN